MPVAGEAGGMTQHAGYLPDLNATPAPWKGYNPGDWSQRYAVAFVAIPAFLAAAYMALYQWGLISTVWDPFFGKQTLTVLDSEQSHRMEAWFRMPDAALGAIGYLGDVVLAMAGSRRRWQYRPWMVMIFGLDVIPLGIVGIILVAVQTFVIGAFCTLCILTAVLSIIMIWLAYDEVWTCGLYLWRLWKRTHSWKTVWWTFWGYPSKEADEVGEQMIVRQHVGASR